MENAHPMVDPLTMADLRPTDLKMEKVHLTMAGLPLTMAGLRLTVEEAYSRRTTTFSRRSSTGLTELVATRRTGLYSTSSRAYANSASS